jgi:hypothetical protein
VPPRFQDPVSFCKEGGRLLEVLENGVADNKIDRLGLYGPFIAVQLPELVDRRVGLARRIYVKPDHALDTSFEEPEFPPDLHRILKPSTPPASKINNDIPRFSQLTEAGVKNNGAVYIGESAEFALWIKTFPVRQLPSPYPKLFSIARRVGRSAGWRF